VEAAERKVQRGGVLRLENQFDEPAPKPIRPPLGFCKVTDIDSVELARQFCLVESRLFQAIKPKEYLGKGWEAKNKEVVAPNLSAFIAHFNRISNWVAATVVDAPDEKKRVALVEYWIKVGEKLFELNNFAGLMELVGGLGSTSVVRLKKTWKNVSRSRKAAWDRLLQQMSPQKSFANYRGCIRAAHAPLVPYLGVYMQDMVFIEDGNPDFLKENGYINFHKRRLLADVIKDIVQHQLAPYNIEPVDEIVDFLALQQPEPETVLYQRSLVIQPREAD
jgi:son of sevenless-like protein